MEGNSVEAYAYDTRNLGRHMSRLHIEPSSNPTLDFDRCNPETILRILKHTTGLQALATFEVSGRRLSSACGVLRRSPRQVQAWRRRR